MRNILLLIACASFAAGCSEDAQTPPRQTPHEAGANTTDPKLRDKWGVEITGVRLSAAGYMIDFRCRVVDPKKALPLLKRQTKPYLIDQKTGAKLIVPTPPKVGPLRQTPLEATAGRVYFAMFANPGRLIKAGNKVTIVIGDFRAEDLVVQ